MSNFNGFFKTINPVLIFLIIVCTFSMIIGFLMNFAGRILIKGLIRESEIFERSGLFQKAQQKYENALRIFDTFLLSPFWSRTILKQLSGSMAKFDLSSNPKNQNFRMATAAYLKMNPMDMDIVSSWLEHLYQTKEVGPLEHEVLTLLADIHHADESVCSILAEIFLGLERKDFTAKKLYQSVLGDSTLNGKYRNRVKELVREEEKPVPEQRVFPKLQPKKRIEINKIVAVVGEWLMAVVKFCGLILGSVLSFTVLLCTRIYTFLKGRERFKVYIKWGVLALMSSWVLFFMANTISHMFKSKALEKEKIQIEANIPKPFTIQVAAYLKQTHANRYVDVLKKKGIDATVKKAVGGGKTWYLVRVSEFADKASAASYGQKLKKQKIIDDFFVNNK